MKSLRIRLPALFLLIAITLLGATDPVPPSPVRPTTWATPVTGTTLGNCYRVSDELYRCEQPDKADIPALKTLGIKSLLNLRNWHSDSKAFEKAGLSLLLQRMEADELTVDDLVAALRQIRAAPKPVLVHCWHGSDRTGSVVAAYRIVFQNWSAADALDELRHGGYGYHEKWFPNIITLFESLDAEALRKRVGE